MVFGEITPQAICSRHGLAIGAHPFVFAVLQCCTLALFVVAYPISLILDSMLGEEIGASFSKNELSTLLTIQQEQGHLTEAESAMLQHVIAFSYHPVSEAMHPKDELFSVSIDDTLNKKTMNKILATGHSRVPVCDASAM